MKNYPVEMLTVCGTDGTLKPVRFRVELEDQGLQTVRILEVICVKQTCYVGTEAIIYVCKAQMQELVRMLELKYTIKTHRWALFRVIY